MRNHPMSKGLVGLLLGGCLWLLVPAQALARSVIRFVHAVPSVGRVELSLGHDGRTLRRVGAIGFGEATSWHHVRSGRLRWALSRGGRTLAHGTTTVGSGAYDIVVLERGSGVALGVYRARAGRAGESLVRVIHAAPQLGTPELTVDGRMAVGRLSFSHATGYAALPAGRHTLGAERAGGHAPFLSRTMTLTAGRSYSAIVLGSAGRRVRVIELVDHGPSHPAQRVGSAAHPRSAGTVVVAPGDSLWSIAHRLIGPGASNRSIERRLIAIWKANATRIGTGDPSLIRPGTHLRV